MNSRSGALTDRNRRRALQAIGGSLAALAIGDSPGQSFPSKPIRLIVPFQPGGNADLVGRRVGDSLSRLWGQSVFVENIAGASGNVGAQAVARAEPDGHTLLFFAHSILTINPWLVPNTAFSVERDLTPVVRVYDTVNVLLVSKKSGFQSYDDFLAYAKAKPGALNFGSGGSGTTTHLALEALCSAAGIRAVHVPYKGSGPAALALLSGEIDAVFEAAPTAAPRVTAGQVRAVATGGSKRSASLPEIPTFIEAGLGSFDTVLVGGIAVSSHTPRAVMQAIHDDTVRVINQPELKQFFADGGSEVGTGSLDEFERWIAVDRAQWGKLVRERNITV